jgi:hypothetical protein
MYTNLKLAIHLALLNYLNGSWIGKEENGK